MNLDSNTPGVRDLELSLNKPSVEDIIQRVECASFKVFAIGGSTERYQVMKDFNKEALRAYRKLPELKPFKGMRFGDETHHGFVVTYRHPEKCVTQLLPFLPTPGQWPGFDGAILTPRYFTFLELDRKSWFLKADYMRKD